MFSLSYNIEINKIKQNISHTTKPALELNCNHDENLAKHMPAKFDQWLAGLIDGDGCFKLSKKGYASLEIVMELRDKHCLYQIKQKYGGSIKLRAGDNHLRYRLHHKTGILNIINALNGLIRNPVRILQLGKICLLYNIELKPNEPLNFSDG